MDLLMLPGMSEVNRGWIKEVEDTFSVLFERTSVQSYLHWEKGGSFNFEDEYERLKQNARDLPNYMIFAKSVGTILSFKGIFEGFLKPQKCIFVGVSLPMLESMQGQKKWLENYSIPPTLFIQKTHDPAGHFVKLKAMVETHLKGQIQFAEIEGNNHNYDDVELLFDLSKIFLNTY